MTLQKQTGHVGSIATRGPQQGPLAIALEESRLDAPDLCTTYNR